MLTCDILLQFLERFDENKRLMMLEIYIESFEEHLSACQAAVQKRDHDMLKSNVHDLKSLCLMLEANEAGQRAGRIEKALKSEEIDAAYNEVPELLLEVKEMLRVMQQAV